VPQWEKGQSGNPSGRPKKMRALTEILERAGGKTVQHGDRRLARRRLIAEMAWEAATTGVVTFPDGKRLEVGANDWFDVLKWIYQHIDGPAKTQMELTGSGGGPLVIAIGGVDLDEDI